MSILFKLFENGDQRNPFCFQCCDLASEKTYAALKYNTLDLPK